jgi:hypothetical protein
MFEAKAIPYYGLGIILLDTPTKSAGSSYSVLCIFVSLLGGLLIPCADTTTRAMISCASTWLASSWPTITPKG